YRIAYNDDIDPDGKIIRRIYRVDPKGLATFAFDMSKVYKDGKIRTLKNECCSALLKCYIEVNSKQYIWRSPELKTVRISGVLSLTPCRPYWLMIEDNKDIGEVNELAITYQEEYSDLIPKIFEKLFPYNINKRA
ncbi:MAG: hypothetical protein ACHQ6U_10900, partial [Thermodesulfobacteriota bacterium]